MKKSSPQQADRPYVSLGGSLIGQTTTSRSCLEDLLLAVSRTLKQGTAQAVLQAAKRLMQHGHAEEVRQHLSHIVEGGDSILSRWQWSSTALSGDREIVTQEAVGVRDLKIGLVWRSASESWNSMQRSCPLSALQPLTALPGIKLCSLQKDATETEKTTLDHMGITDLSSELRDWDVTAGVMANLDLVLTIDSGPAHLSGALNVPTWILLPVVADWRWGLTNVTPWYPSMRLFRQPRPGAWGAAVIEALRGLWDFS